MKKLMLIASILATSLAMADKVTLNSGTVLTGKILGTEGDVIKFESDDFGKLDVKKANIAKIVGAAEKPVAVAEIAPVPKEPETWHGSVNVSLQADRGNTFGNSASVLLNLNRRWEEDRVKFDFGYYYTKNGASKQDWTKSKDKIEAEGQYDHFWTKKFFSYVNVRYDRDMLQFLSNRIKLGLGLGYQWLEKTEFESTGTWSFDQELGATWGYDDWDWSSIISDDTRVKSYASFRYAHHLTWVPKWAKDVEVFHNFEYLPHVDDWSYFQAKSDIGFSTKIVWNIDMLAKIEWEHFSKPIGDRKKDDVRCILGLGYKW